MGSCTYFNYSLYFVHLTIAIVPVSHHLLFLEAFARSVWSVCVCAWSKLKLPFFMLKLSNLV